MLELDDIQHILLTRTPAMTGRYEFLSFDDPAGGRAWLTALLDRVQSVADARTTLESSERWITLAFTWRGLRALGVSEEALATFPDEFREGMAARADILSDTGANHPDHWVGGLAGDDLHAIAILFARTDAEHRRCTAEHHKLVASCRGVRVLSFLDLNATPPFAYAHDHFGFRDRLSQPVIDGSGEEPTPGSGAPLKPGEFILGYPDEEGPPRGLPQPEVLSRNGSYIAYRRLQEHVGAFRNYLREHADTPQAQELLAAKLMGRWRSGAPLVLAPDRDDPQLAADPMRNNDFNYKEMDPHGYAVPLGSHVRRLNPRDTAANMNRRRMIRRGATYGPKLPEDAPDDGVDRGIAAFIICASLVRQFEFAQNVWINDKTFHELGNERDPICGTQDGSMDFTIPKRPIRTVLAGLPAFTTLKGGAYFFLPGISALRYLATLDNREVTS
ncbi:Dyp-type peroxidase [Nocardia australiensis]|uniref:Dyp-type peroxidase n=1 Tax=Nocardia australiensis TaxID=2887191 RepID=UPI001D149F76|nr:peroxidase [Nocardia australiensis]